MSSTPPTISRLDGAQAADLALWFPTTELAHIGDEVADGAWIGGPDEPLPLSLFDGPRVDFSLARLRHYTGTPPEHSQRYLLFTNYVRYVDEFVRWAVEELERDDSPYEALSAPGGIFITKGTPDAVAKVQEGPWRKHQMPAYHLIAAARRGDQPGQYRRRPLQRQDDLRSSRGDAARGVADDRPLRRSPPQPVDRRLCPRPRLSARRPCHGRRAADRGADPGASPRSSRPCSTPPSRSPARTPQELKQRLRTGTVVTTDDRNWELRYTLSALRFNQSRAVAIDMESATVAAQGYRFRVPYGTLLCVSDKPLHGEIKLPGQANAFYERAISQHLRIGIEALRILRREGAALHSRKLRAFDEPPFR